MVISPHISYTQPSSLSYPETASYTLYTVAIETASFSAYSLRPDNNNDITTKSNIVRTIFANTSLIITPPHSPHFLSASVSSYRTVGIPYSLSSSPTGYSPAP